MSIKILTKNGVENTNIDGVRNNNFIAGKKSGITKGVLNECAVYAVNNILGIQKGELRISGHIVVITETEIKTMVNIPNTPQLLSLIAQILVDDNGDPSFSFIIQDKNTVLIQENLDSQEKGNGTYQIRIANFTQNTEGDIEDIEYVADKITGADAIEIEKKLEEKVSKVTGKDLSDNNFSNDYKDKIDNLNGDNVKLTNYKEYTGENITLEENDNVNEALAKTQKYITNIVDKGGEPNIINNIRVGETSAPINNKEALIDGAIINEALNEEIEVSDIFEYRITAKNENEIFSGGTIKKFGSRLYRQELDKSNYLSTQVKNGVTITNNGDGSLTLNGTCTENALIVLNSVADYIVGHKYMLIGTPSNRLNSYIYALTDAGGYTFYSDTGNGVIFTCPTNNAIFYISLAIKNDDIYDNVIYKPQLIDLSAQIYTQSGINEDSTVDDVKALIGDRILGYGVNEFVPTTLSSEGYNMISNTTSVNLLANHKYFVKGTNLKLYLNDSNQVTDTTGTGIQFSCSTSGTYTITNGSLTSSLVVDLGVNSSLTLSQCKEMFPFKAYEKSVVTLPTIDTCSYWEDNKKISTCAKVNLGNQTWIAEDTSGYCTLSNVKVGGDLTYTSLPSGITSITLGANNLVSVTYSSGAFTNATLKTAFANIYLYYELTTPTETTLEFNNNYYFAENYGHEYFNTLGELTATYVQNNELQIREMQGDIEYIKNNYTTKTYVDNLFASLTNANEVSY